MDRRQVSEDVGGGEEATPAAGRISTTNSSRTDEASKNTKSLILLLATLATTITYQAGLVPPGGVWPDDTQGHRPGDPILLSTAHATRYKLFFYCNSIAFLASLAAILLVQNEKLVKGNKTLLASMILDMFALIGAYAAGSCRDVRSTIGVVALASGAIVYLLIQVLVFPPKEEGTANTGEVKKEHKRLLLLAVLVATITYQAGLTPPGGFWQDQDGHAAGNSVLLDTDPGRFHVFFYGNTMSFMTSVVLILFLISPRLYQIRRKWYALYACISVALLGLMAAYAAGTAWTVGTSTYVLVLIVSVVIFIAVHTVRYFWHVIGGIVISNDSRALPEAAGEPRETTYREEYAHRKYLMLLGVLVASVTYQAGIDQPGGMWQQDGDGDHREAGSPVLEDIDTLRYRVFFYSNYTSFVASVIVIVIILLLQQVLRPKHASHKRNQLLLLATNTTVALDLLGLLVAYAAGSTREWKSAVALLGPLVLFVIAVHVSPRLFNFDSNALKLHQRQEEDLNDRRDPFRRITPMPPS